MWIVTGLAGGERRDLIARVVEGEEPPSLEQVREAASGLPRAERLVRYIDAELRITRDNQRFVRSFDAVQRWSARAEAESRDFTSVRDRFVSLSDAEGALGYFSASRSRNPEAPDSVVWHAHTIVVVSVPEGVDQIDFEYRPEPRDTVRLERLTSRFQTSAHAVETILDARGCRGADSELIEHFRAMRARGNGFFTSIRGTADMLVGRILHRVATSEPAPLEDMTYQPRLHAMQQQWQDLAKACPDIGAISDAREHDAAIVFIHGTLSCGLLSLTELFPGALPAFPVYRYEHDTFMRVSANGRELAQSIAKYINAKRLLLVAHSRGGLVGRAALAALPKHGFTGDTHLLTFGTPHAGTPLVKIAKGVLNLLLKIGSQIVDGIPLMVPIVAAACHAYNVSSLPDGIAIMAEGDERLDMLNDAMPVAQVRCWGSAFDPARGESGFGFDIENTLFGAMGREPHDLVVSTRSALAYGTQQPVLSCSHSRYFAQPPVRSAILEAVAPEPSVPKTAPGRIHDGPTRVTTGGIGIMKTLRFNPRLAQDSRLPQWFTLPEGTARDDVTVHLKYTSSGSSAEMMLTLVQSARKLQSVTCAVLPYARECPPGEHPTREILEVKPSMVEIIEYRTTDPVFHVVDEARHA